MKSCRFCKYSYSDMDGGWNCTKYDGEVYLSSGAKFPWPGLNCRHVRSEKGPCGPDTKGYTFSLGLGWIFVGAVM